jgi:hypothetical protein
MEFHVTVVVPAKMPPTSPPTLEDCANGEADLTRCSKKLEEWLANPSDDGSMKVHVHCDEVRTSLTVGSYGWTPTRLSRAWNVRDDCREHARAPLTLVCLPTKMT